MFSFVLGFSCVFFCFGVWGQCAQSSRSSGCAAATSILPLFSSQWPNHANSSSSTSPRAFLRRFSFFQTKGSNSIGSAAAILGEGGRAGGAAAAPPPPAAFAAFLAAFLASWAARSSSVISVSFLGPRRFLGASEPPAATEGASLSASLSASKASFLAVPEEEELLEESSAPFARLFLPAFSCLETAGGFKSQVW